MPLCEKNNYSKNSSLRTYFKQRISIIIIKNHANLRGFFYTLLLFRLS